MWDVVGVVVGGDNVVVVVGGVVGGDDHMLQDVVVAGNGVVCNVEVDAHNDGMGMVGVGEVGRPGCDDLKRWVPRLGCQEDVRHCHVQ